MTENMQRSDDREPAPQAQDRATPANAGAAQVPGDAGFAAYPIAEAEYWREAHVSEPYYEAGRSFADYGTAYELGWVSYRLYGGEFDTAERVLANDWLVRKGVSTLSWDQARPAVRAAWQRAESARSFASDGTATAQEVAQTLADLFATARDAELGLVEAAAHARAPELAALFERMGQHYAQAAAQLQAQIQEDGGSASEGGTIGAAAQRVWLQLRGIFGAGDEAMLSICERGQDDVMAHYRAALGRNLPLQLHALVQGQFELAQRQRDHIKRLRDRASAAPADQEQPA